MRSWTSERRAAVKGLLLAGLSHAQIARRLGMSRDTVSGGIRRYALAPGATVPEKPSRKEPADLWTEARLTARWSDRRRAA
jgi:hypothetical protein